MSTDAAPFKTCPSCGSAWATRDALLADPELSFVGYQAWIQDGVLGMFLFNHLTCSTTLAVSARHFGDVGRHTVSGQGGQPLAETPGYCLSAGRPAECPPQCECGFVAEVVARIKGRQ